MGRALFIGVAVASIVIAYKRCTSFCRFAHECFSWSPEHDQTLHHLGIHSSMCCEETAENRNRQRLATDTGLEQLDD